MLFLTAPGVMIAAYVARTRIDDSDAHVDKEKSGAKVI